nr:MAG TPA: hypothetical protein [Caudoviricetes sp.]
MTRSKNPNCGHSPPTHYFYLLIHPTAPTHAFGTAKQETPNSPPSSGMRTL